MKLLFCPLCQDVVKLQQITRQCLCGKSEGYYLPDGDHAVIKGQGIPLGFANSSLVNALESRPVTGKGSLFTAFVIPKSCPTIDDQGQGSTLAFTGKLAKEKKMAELALLLSGDLNGDFLQYAAPATKKKKPAKTRRPKVDIN